jgi:6-pyruvoyltetrahydropterin/6-carboxytetrahydropterin synthase
MKHPITRRLEVDAGHRLLNHEGKCRNYHGHRYVVEVTCAERDRLDAVGRVLDFGVVKERFGGWLDKYVDHGMVLQRGDPMIAVLYEQAARTANGTSDMEYGSDGTLFHIPSPKLTIIDMPPTAENFAEWFYIAACAVLPLNQLVVLKVRVHETPNCYAEFGS